MYISDREAPPHGVLATLSRSKSHIRHIQRRLTTQVQNIHPVLNRVEYTPSFDSLFSILEMLARPSHPNFDNDAHLDEDTKQAIKFKKKSTP